MDVLRNKFSYGLEYLGHQTPLVWSDSLERCYKIMGIALGECVHVPAPAVCDARC